MYDLMNMMDAAEKLRLVHQTLYNWFSEVSVSGIKVDGVWRFDRKELHKWLKRKNLKF